jgi:hypothetical protein
MKFQTHFLYESGFQLLKVSNMLTAKWVLCVDYGLAAPFISFQNTSVVAIVSKFHGGNLLSVTTRRLDFHSASLFKGLVSSKTSTVTSPLST